MYLVRVGTFENIFLQILENSHKTFDTIHHSINIPIINF